MRLLESFQSGVDLRACVTHEDVEDDRCSRTILRSWLEATRLLPTAEANRPQPLNAMETWLGSAGCLREDQSLSSTLACGRCDGVVTLWPLQAYPKEKGARTC